MVADARLPRTAGFEPRRAQFVPPRPHRRPTTNACAYRTLYLCEPSYRPKKDGPSKDATAKNEASTSDPQERAQEAAARFSDKTAAELLPVSATAAQAQTSTAMPIQPAVNLAAEQKAQAGQQPAASGPKYTGEPISVNLKDVDLKDFFRLIHEISGLNVVLDPNVHGTLTIVLDDVPWDQALDIVLKNNDLARELEGNVLRIATVETLKTRSGVTARADRSRSPGRRESFGNPFPELRQGERRNRDGEEVPLATRRRGRR